ncbi:carbohydrate kinase [Amycolatopsis endophytica]|uniref:Fructokinase n=1 Tax=Amycolatopsis endophytica TaxID=860233 RepID=A0A853B2N2_9PSEU|nr:carbohydrate kinase [Amycolatopsis endophytica]NYI89269.1 fructokinase [Amycolatopsis endophytica]
MIVVGGEALVDMVPGAEKTNDGLTSLVPRLGGGPYNVALAAGRLGTPTAFLSRVSTDRFGQALRDRLIASDVDISMVQEGPEHTTLAVVALAPNGSASYTFYTEGSADRLVEDPGPLPEDVKILCLGTLGMVLEPGATNYETVLRRESARGVLTALDPNIRAALIADADAYRRRFLSWLPDVRLLKLSDDDAEWLAGTDDLDAAVKSWLDAGVDAVVLTRGGDGLAVHTGSVTVPVPSAPARLVDTIGAGDTVQGALLSWLHEKNVGTLTGLGETEWREALTFAAKAASITVSRSGAEPPTAAEMV